MKTKQHFKALISLSTSDKGGIVTPISSGFRAVIKFPLDTTDYSANFTFLESEMIFPGDTAVADLWLLKPDNASERIYAGLDFNIFINSKQIANGVISTVY